MGLLLLCVCQMMSVGDLVHFSILFSGQAEVFLFSEWALGFPREVKQLDVSVPSTAQGSPLSDALLILSNSPIMLGPSKLKEGQQIHQNRDLLPSSTVQE